MISVSCGSCGNCGRASGWKCGLICWRAIATIHLERAAALERTPASMSLIASPRPDNGERRGDAISDIEAGVRSKAAALSKWIVAIARQQIRPHFQPEALPQFPQLPQLTEIIERRHALRARGRGPADRFLIVPDDSFDVHPPEVTRRIERDALERDRDFGRPAFRV